MINREETLEEQGGNIHSKMRERVVGVLRLECSGRDEHPGTE